MQSVNSGFWLTFRGGDESEQIYHDKGLSVGTPICQTSRAFLYGMLSDKSDNIVEKMMEIKII